MSLLQYIYLFTQRPMKTFADAFCLNVGYLEFFALMNNLLNLPEELHAEIVDSVSKLKYINYFTIFMET